MLKAFDTVCVIKISVFLKQNLNTLQKNIKCANIFTDCVLLHETKYKSLKVA